MSLRYNGKVIPRTSSKFFNLEGQNVQPELETVWQRPGDWLAMPAIASTDHKVDLLIAVFEPASNYISFTCAGAYTVDWGDGVVQNFASGANATHLYDYSALSPSTSSTRGYRQAIATITPQAGQNLTSVNLNSTPSGVSNYNIYANNILQIQMSLPNVTTLTVGGGGTYGRNPRIMESFVCVNAASLTSWAGMFNSAAPNLRHVRLSGLGNVTSFAQTFLLCGSLIDIEINHTASTVTNCSQMFYECRKISKLPMFNTSRVTDMGQAFFRCSSLRYVPLYDLSSCTTISQSFYECFSLEYVPPINTIKVTNFSQTFHGCDALKKFPGFNFSAALDCSGMFNYCYGLSNVGVVTIPNATNISGMFFACYGLSNVDAIHAPKATNWYRIFYQCYSLTRIGALTTTAATSFAESFTNCQTLEAVPPFDASKVTSLSNTFGSCYALKEVPYLDTSNVTDMSYTFQYCYSLTTVPNFNTPKVTSMYLTFFSCTSLKSVPDFSFTAALTNVYRALDSTGIRKAPNWNTSNVTEFSLMFYSCGALEEVPLIDTSKATSMAQMFGFCSSLKTLPKFVVPNVTSFSQIFFYCYLNRATFSGTTSSIDYSAQPLSTAELIDIFNNLGTAAGTQTINITNCLGTAGLTAGDRAIATGKGWTITG